MNEIIRTAKVKSMQIAMHEAGMYAEELRDNTTDQHTREKADAIARQLRELVTEAEGLV